MLQHHEMRNVSVSIVIAIGLSASGLLAQPVEVVELEPFYVMGRNSVLEPETLSGEHWRGHSVVGLAELLEDSEPGLSLVRKAGMSNDLVIRGLGGDDVSVTLDGRKIYCACSNRMDPPLSHAIAENAERVEVAAGPFSLKRSGSLGGHINVVSAEIRSGEHGRFEGRDGSFKETAFSAWASAGTETLAVRVQGAWLSSDPYENGDGVQFTDFPEGLAAYLDEAKDDKAYEAWHAGVELQWQASEQLMLKANYLRREDEDVLFPGLKMDADETQTNQFGIRFESEVSAAIVERWVADFYYNETDHLMSDRRRLSSQKGMGGVDRPGYVLERGWFMETDAESSNFGATLDAELAAMSFGNWKIGGEFDRRSWDSDNVIGPNENAMLPDVDLDTVGIYAEGQFEFDSEWLLDLGFRMDRFDASAGGDTSFLESVGRDATDQDFIEPGAFLSVRNRLSESTALFAGVGSVARSPNPQELYIQVDKPMMNPDWVGNPDLDAPRSTELTAGLEYTNEVVAFRARAFHAWLDDYIYQVKESGGSTFQSYTNIDARLYGVELKTEYTVSKHLTLSAALAWQEGEKRDRPMNATNDELAEIPPLRAQAVLTYLDDQNRISLEARVSDGQNNTDPDLNEQDLGSWFTLSARWQRKLDKHWTLGVAVENIFDESYAVHNAQVRNPFSAFTVVDEPGRSLKARLSYEF